MRIPALLVVLIACLPLPACATTYSAEAINGRVIDKETGKPIESVSVVASWGLFYGTLGGRNAVGSLVILEAQTDQDGRFTITSWGPKSVKDVAMKQETPNLTFFKPGFRVEFRDNDPSLPTTTYRTRSDWDGKTIPLSKFEGTIAEYGEHLNLVTGIFEHSSAELYQSKCGWKLIPKTLRALKAQDDAFRHSGIKLRFINDLKGNEAFFQSQGCGSINEFLGGKHE